MIRHKFIILPFLLTAWAIIFAHSIIPHHHHNQNDTLSHCQYNQVLTDLDIQQEQFNNFDHDCTDHACHFHVDVLTKISIDQVFITNSDNDYSNYLIESKSGKMVFDKAFFSDQIPKTNYLRGPPLLA